MSNLSTNRSHFPNGFIFNEGGGMVNRWTRYAGKQPCWDCHEGIEHESPYGHDELYMMVESSMPEDVEHQQVVCLDHIGVFATPHHVYAL